VGGGYGAGGNGGSGIVVITYTPITAPTVTTNAASLVSGTSATLIGSITATGGAGATQTGFALSTNSSLSSGVSTSTLGSYSGTGPFTQSLSSLSLNTTYYVRAYATNTYGTGYGSVQSFITIPTIILTGNVKFLGNLAIVGSLTKGAGTFEIDDPIDPANKILFHSFVESPDALNIYDGIATLDKNGEVTIQLPDYYDALNQNSTYQFFPMDQAMPDLYVKTEEANNQFTIAGGVPGGQISWQISGVRHDPYILANPIIVEVEKGPGQLVDKGFCIYAPDCQ
jgi:hypothetical protein